MRTNASRRARRDERGAILILSTAGIVLAIIAASLAVDLGFVAHEVRVDQKVADLAAMDAIRVLPSDPTSAAQLSATRNEFPYGSPGYALVVKWGPTKTGPWSSSAADLAAATAVQVTATSPHKNFFPFVAEALPRTRSAVAVVQDKAQFSVGSNLASLDTNDSLALNRMMNGIFGTGSGINLTMVGYQGLAATSVSLADLVAADTSLGTPDDLLNNTVTVRRLAQAAVVALNNKGDVASLAAATALGSFANTINTALTVSLGDILSIEQPAAPGSVAAQTQFNVFDLITGAGQAAISNGAGFVTIPGFTVSVPGLTSATLKLTVIEPPQISAFGPALFDASTGTWATTARTAQVKLELTTKITVPAGGCAGFLPTCVVMDMPLVVSAANAVGSLTDIRCAPGSREADVEVASSAANATADNVLTVKLVGLNLIPPLSVVSTNVALAGSSPPHPELTFTNPPALPSAIQSTAAPGAGLTVATQSQLTLLGVIPVGPLLTLLSPVTSAVDEEILEPVMNALGLSVAGADVRMLRIECGVPVLAS